MDFRVGIIEGGEFAEHGADPILPEPSTILLTAGGLLALGRRLQK